MPPSDVEQAEKVVPPRCLCGICEITTGTIVIGMLEFLVICHALIFAFSNYSAGEDRYELYNPIFAEVIKYDYFLPLLVIQLVWLVSCIVLIFGVKMVLCWLLLPHIVVQVGIVLGGSWLCIMALINMQSLEELSWELMAAVTFCVLVTISELYLTYVVILCFRHIKHLAVALADEKRWRGSARDRVWSSRPGTRHATATLTQKRPLPPINPVV